MDMIKKIQITGVFLMLLCSQKVFSQHNSGDDTLQFKSENIKRNTQEKVTVYTGNVSLVSPYINFDDAEKSNSR